MCLVYFFSGALLLGHRVPHHRPISVLSVNDLSTQLQRYGVVFML
jgi:hypothetical protein